MQNDLGNRALRQTRVFIRAPFQWSEAEAERQQKIISNFPTLEVSREQAFTIKKKKKLIMEFVA